VPVLVYTPYLLVFMRRTAKVVNTRQAVGVATAFLVTLPFAEIGARWLRDRLYWPLVRQLYLGLKEEERLR